MANRAGFRKGGLELGKKSSFDASNPDTITIQSDSSGTLYSVDENGIETEIGTGSLSGSCTQLTNNGIDISTMELSGGVPTSLVPDASGVYDLGSPDLPWRSGYFSENSLYLGDNKLSTENGTLKLNDEFIRSNIGTQQVPARSSILTMSEDQTTDLSVGDAIKFNQIEGDHELDASTFRVKVKAGAVAFLEASIYCSYTTTSNAFVRYVWYDTTASVFVGAKALCLGNNSSQDASQQTTAMARVTPSVDTEYELRIENSNEVAGVFAARSWAAVTEMPAANGNISNVVGSDEGTDKSSYLVDNFSGSKHLTAHGSFLGSLSNGLTHIFVNGERTPSDYYYQRDLVDNGSGDTGEGSSSYFLEAQSNQICRFTAEVIIGENGKPLITIHGSRVFDSSQLADWKTSIQYVGGSTFTEITSIEIVFSDSPTTITTLVPVASGWLKVIDPTVAQTGAPDLWEDAEYRIPGRWHKTGSDAFVPVYRLEKPMTAQPNASTAQVAHGLSNIDEVLSAGVRYKDAAGDYFFVAGSDQDDEYASLDSTNLEWTSTQDRTTSVDPHMVVEYTKTTDTPVTRSETAGNGGSGGGFTPLEGEGITITSSGSDYVFSVDDYISSSEVENISSNLQTQIDNISGSSDLYILSSGDTLTGQLTISDSGSIVPQNDNVVTIGTSANRFSDIWAEEVHVGASSLYVNGKKVLEDVSDTITISTEIDQNLAIKTSGMGNTNISSAESINLDISDTNGSNIVLSNTSNNGNINLQSNNQINLTGTIRANGNLIETQNNKSVANGYASLDSNAKIPASELPDSIVGQVSYQGTWAPSTNTPSVSNPPDSLTKGYYYVCADSGTQFGIDFQTGDWLISNGTIWQKVDNTDAVMTVFGRLGNVVAISGDYTGSQITNVPSGNVTSTNTQGAINELDTRITNLDVGVEEVIGGNKLTASTVGGTVTIDHDETTVSEASPAGGYGPDYIEGIGYDDYGHVNTIITSSLGTMATEESSSYYTSAEVDSISDQIDYDIQGVQSDVNANTNLISNISVEAGEGISVVESPSDTWTVSVDDYISSSEVENISANLNSKFGTLTFSGDTISADGSTVTIDDDLSISSDLLTIGDWRLDVAAGNTMNIDSNSSTAYLRMRDWSSDSLGYMGFSTTGFQVYNPDSSHLAFEVNVADGVGGDESGNTANLRRNTNVNGSLVGYQMGAEDSVNAQKIYGGIFAQIDDNTAGAHDGALAMYVADGGSLSRIVDLTPNGMALASGKTITSPDGDTTHTLGRAAIGYNGGDSDAASFGHRDHTTGGGYAVQHSTTGNLFLNCESGQNIYFRENDSNVVLMDDEGFYFAAGKGFRFGATGDVLDSYQKPDNTWTPTGNGIVFDSAAGDYGRIGGLEFVGGFVTFPTTSSTSIASISGIPSNPVGQTWRGVTPVGYTNGGSPLSILLSTSGNEAIIRKTDGTAYNNADLSGATIYFGFILRY